MPEAGFDDGSYFNTQGQYQNPAFGGQVEEAPVPGKGTPEGRGITAEFASHRSPGQQAVNRFQDQSTYSNLWLQQQKWLKELHTAGKPLPPGFANLPEGTTPKDLIRIRSESGRLPPALGGAGSAKRNPFKLYTDEGEREISGPLGSRFLDNFNWGAGLQNVIPGTAGWEERKQFAQQASVTARAMRNMLTRGRTNPEYWGNEADRKVLQRALKADMLPRLGFDKKDVNWVMRNVGGGPEALQSARDLIERRAVGAYKKTVNELEEYLKTKSPAELRLEIATKFPHVKESDRGTWARGDGKSSRGLTKPDLIRIIQAGGDPTTYTQLLGGKEDERPEDRQPWEQEQFIEQLRNAGIDDEKIREILADDTTETPLVPESKVNGNQDYWRGVHGDRGKGSSIERLEAAIFQAREDNDDDMADVLEAELYKLQQGQKISPDNMGAAFTDRDLTIAGMPEGGATQKEIINQITREHANPESKWDNEYYAQTAYEYIKGKVIPNMGSTRTQNVLATIVDRAEKGDDDAKMMLNNLLHLHLLSVGGKDYDWGKFKKSVPEDPMDMAWAILKIG
jgi:hypothetical protein|tara:strand:- start:6833 stop:8533 length:1701 start_codon:yes stop_codon:yes gene_type:complete